MPWRETDPELRDFVENVPVPLCLIARDGTIVWANAAELRLLGYAAPEYIGHSITEFCTEGPAVGEFFERLIGNGDLHELHQGLCIHCQTHDDQPSLDPAHAGPAASQEQDELQIRATIYGSLGIPLEEIALTDPATYALMTASAA